MKLIEPSKFDQLGSPIELLTAFGKKDDFYRTVKEFEPYRIS
jgi:hypothetical protein